MRNVNSNGDPLNHRLSAIGYQLSAISYRLSVIGYQLSAISYRLSPFASRLFLHVASGSRQHHHTLDVRRLREEIDRRGALDRVAADQGIADARK